MTITRFAPALRFASARRPFGEVALLQNRVNSIFEDLGWQPEDESGVTKSNFVPAVDVYEDAQKVTVTLDVPGSKQEDLSVRLENQTLTVKGSGSSRLKRRSRTFTASSAATEALCARLRFRRLLIRSR